jgi:pectate lyase
MFTMVLITLYLVGFATTFLQAAYAQNAFSGAVGFGAIATGGNSGTTYTVTNLDDSGTGSFRDAVSASNRNIVFSVSGYIELASAVSLSSDITINGQTAPSPGIGIMAGEVSASGRSNISKCEFHAKYFLNWLSFKIVNRSFYLESWRNRNSCSSFYFELLLTQQFYSHPQLAYAARHP